MDGISLCRELHRLDIGTKCILITGYQDFSVAMEATSLPNIIQILLKPTSIFTVTKAVQDAIRLIEKEKARQLLEARIRLKESENQKLQASLLLSQMLTGNESLRETLAERFLTLNYGAARYYLMQIRCKTHDNTVQPDYQQIREYVDRIFSDITYVQVSADTTHTFKYYIPVSADPASFLNHLLNCSHDLVNVIDCCTDVSACIGFSSEYHSITELPKANDEADAAVQFALFQTDIPVCLFSDIPSNSSNWYDFFQPVITNILESIGLFNYEQTQYWFDELLSRARTVSLSPEYYRQLCIMAVDSCFEQNYRMNRLENDFVAVHAISYKKLKSFPTLEALTETTLSILESHMQQRKTLSPQDLVRQIEQYVSQNYRKDLSLESIAAAFFISPSYLSRLFKQKTSVNLITYIQETRIEKAKELALNTEMHAYEIGEAIGISDPVYFSKLFKKKTGYNISRFRENMKNGQ